jgi:hypothetical protein
MATTVKATKAGKKGRTAHPRTARGAGKAMSSFKGSAKHTAVVVEEARQAAQRETGITSPTELGILALATLAQPDPAAEYLKRSYGVLGKDHKLEI